MRTIAIVLGDNDFGKTFRPLLKTLLDVIKYYNGDVDEEFVRRVLLEGVRFHYAVYQASTRWIPPQWPKEDALLLTMNYFDGFKILFDEEAEQDILTRDHDGGAWYLDLQTDRIESY